MRVYCTVPNGLLLRVGMETVELQRGENRVADEFFALWARLHAESALLASGAILAEPDPPPEPEPPPDGGPPTDPPWRPPPGL